MLNGEVIGRVVVLWNLELWSLVVVLSYGIDELWSLVVVLSYGILELWSCGTLELLGIVSILRPS